MGTVRWGNKKTWMEIKPKREGEELRVTCSVAKLPDVLPGDDGKHCQCAVRRDSPFYRSVNPALLPTLAATAGGGTSSSSDLVASCEVFEAGAQDGPWGSSLWEATKAFCARSWAESPAGQEAKAGPRALDPGTLRGLMRAWVDVRFIGNHARFFDKSGWAKCGFVNYYAGAPGGKHTRMTEELIKSVHAFSSKPIVVVHFGFSTPTDWTAEKFPQLVLLHAAPIPANAGRSFNFNKFRAMMLSRVRVGVQLDSDQFVAPGVDAIFQRTEQEITKDYPFPILPVHFLDRGPKDQGAYWERFCPKGKCQWQTARWGHAHPTWTFWALPFLGRWLRRNFRDEVLPVRAGGAMRALRVVNVPEDEDLLNVGTWEEGGTKQWCKLDLPGPGDFEALTARRVRSSKPTALAPAGIGLAETFQATSVSTPMAPQRCSTPPTMLWTPRRPGGGSRSSSGNRKVDSYHRLSSSRAGSSLQERSCMQHIQTRSASSELRLLPWHSLGKSVAVDW